MTSKLVLFRDGSARTVDAAALPSLIEDARDDAAALAALVEVAIEQGALDVTAPALARLRALESEDAESLAAQVGIALIAKRDIDATRSIVGVPARAPVWSGALNETSSWIPAKDGIPRVAIFAFSDESGASAASAVGPQTSSGSLTRSLPLAIAEHTLPYADVVVTAPVVAGHGFYVAKRAWTLPEALALSPLKEFDPTHLVTGRVVVAKGDQLAAEIDIWDMREGVLRARVYEHPRANDVVTKLALAIANALAGKPAAAKKKRLPPKAARNVRASPAIDLEATADVHTMLLAASGALNANELVNIDDALAKLNQVNLVAFVVAALAAGVDIDDESIARATTTAEALGLKKTAEMLTRAQTSTRSG